MQSVAGGGTVAHAPARKKPKGPAPRDARQLTGRKEDVEEAREPDLPSGINFLIESIGFVIKNPDAAQDLSIEPSALCVVNGAAKLWRAVTSVELYDHVSVLISGEGATSDAGADFTVSYWKPQSGGARPIKHIVPRNPLLPFWNFKLLHKTPILVVEIIRRHGDKARCAQVARRAGRTCEGSSPDRKAAAKKMAQPKVWQRILKNLAESADVGEPRPLMDDAEAEYEREVNLQPGAIAKRVKVMRAVMLNFAGKLFPASAMGFTAFDALVLSRLRCPSLSRQDDPCCVHNANEVRCGYCGKYFKMSTLGSLQKLQDHIGCAHSQEAAAVLGKYRNAYAKARHVSTSNEKDVSDIDATWDDEPCEWTPVPYEATHGELKIAFPDDFPADTPAHTWSDGSYLVGSSHGAGRLPGASLAATTPGGPNAVRDGHDATEDGDDASKQRSTAAKRDRGAEDE